MITVDRPLAIRCWENALKLNPNYSDCELSLGRERLRDGRYKEAIKLLTHALAADPNGGRSWMDLADADIGVHDYKGASAALDHAEHALFAVGKIDLDKRRAKLLPFLSGSSPIAQ